MDQRVRKIVDNLYGPIGSVLVHIIVLVAMVKFSVTTTKDVTPEFIVEMKDVEETPEQLEELEKLEVLEDPTVVEAERPPEVSLDQAPPSVETSVRSTGPASGGDAADLQNFNVVDSVSPLQYKGLYSGRGTAGRGDALKAYGGGKIGDRAEYSVKKALEYLKNHQYPDGSWGPHYRAAMTGLALLAFLAHGENTQSPEYGLCVKKGMTYLLGCQKKGVFVGGGPYRWGHTVASAAQLIYYEHAIATYAISEAYGLSQIPFLKPAMEQAVQVIIDGQHERGSWDYGYARGTNANMDVSLSGWHLQALKAAMISGAENRGLKLAIDNGMKGLKTMFNTKMNMFQYSTRVKDPPDMSMTGVAVLCMQLSGHALDPEAKSGINTIKDLKCRWTRGDGPNQDQRGVGGWPLYAWYYITQARFHRGGGVWVSWNRDFAPLLCSVQNQDGSWCAAPDSKEAMFGPIYCTSLSTLMLEVYYRFIPTYKAIEVDHGPKADEKKDADDEVKIKFG